MSLAVHTADVVVVGGGVAGLSTAMQLAMRGAKVVVLERDRLGSGSTGRAAGLLGQLRGTAEHTRVLVESVQIIKQLEAEAGIEIFVQTGSLRVATTAERAEEIRRLVPMAQSAGLDVDTLPIDDVARLVPAMKTDDLIEACFCPTDGHVLPAELVNAYVKIGGSHGAVYQAPCRVEELWIEGGKVRGVKTAAGEWHAPAVVNAGGPWSYLIANLAGQTLPTAGIGHFYLTTDTRPAPSNRGAADNQHSPAVRDRHLRIYARPEGNGWLVGMYQAEPVEHEMDRLPDDFEMAAMEAPRDSVYVKRLVHAASQRFPWIDEQTPMRITTGIMSFTPDGQPFCGMLPGADGLYHCAGFSGHGIAQSLAIGKIMAELILDGKTGYDIAAIEADRFFDLPGYLQRSEIKAKCRAMAANYYGGVEGRANDSH